MTKIFRSKALIGISGQLEQVRDHWANGILITKGRFMSSELSLGEFGIIEAETSEAAIELVSQTPYAVAFGIVEVWALEQKDLICPEINVSPLFICG